MMSLRFKRHHKLLVLLALVVALLIAGGGDRPLLAYSLQTAAQPGGLAVTGGHTLAAVVDSAADRLAFVGLPGPAPGYSQGANEIL